jgi:four helix bundle protein
MINNDLYTRTFQFAISVVRLIDKLPLTTVNRIYFSQIIRSTSSIGANYRASQRAKSTKDFINKLKIVEEEADESVYFLELLEAINVDHSLLIKPLIIEGTELLKIFVASIKTTRNRIQSGNSKNNPSGN